MSNGIFRSGQMIFRAVERSDLERVQAVLDKAAYYHTTIVQRSPSGLAQRMYEAAAPQVDGGRVFRHFMMVELSAHEGNPIGVLDIFAGFPSYKICSVASFILRDDCQRKGYGKMILTETLPSFLKMYHPAVTTLSISLTENNVPGMRCLLSSGYERTNRWEKLDMNGKPIIAVTFRKAVSG